MCIEWMCVTVYIWRVLCVHVAACVCSTQSTGNYIILPPNKRMLSIYRNPLYVVHTHTARERRYNTLAFTAGYSDEGTTAYRKMLLTSWRCRCRSHIRSMCIELIQYNALLSFQRKPTEQFTYMCMICIQYFWCRPPMSPVSFLLFFFHHFLKVENSLFQIKPIYRKPSVLSSHVPNRREKKPAKIDGQMCIDTIWRHLVRRGPLTSVVVCDLCESTAAAKRTGESSFGCSEWMENGTEEGTDNNNNNNSVLESLWRAHSLTHSHILRNGSLVQRIWDMSVYV